ncbi:MAG: hypothetical protein ABSB95_05415 [Dissulfurispiraceae bacterium]
MSEKERPLPQPPSTPFGPKKRFERGGDDSPLVADQLLMAMAEGKLDEYIKQEMPGSEQALKLTQMMMGMSGMSGMALPGLVPVSEKNMEEKASEDSAGAAPSELENPVQPPEDLVKAALDGDIKGLMQILRREHEKTNPAASSQKVSRLPGDPDTAHPQPEDLDAGQRVCPAIEKEIVDALAAIAGENSLTMDWLVLRALKLYVGEYKKTGRL